MTRVFWLGALAAGACVALPAAAGAYATAAPPPAKSSVSGLPDGRVYEEVSPANKYGNYVASGGATAVLNNHGYAAAAANGNALVFMGSGAMGGAVSSVLGPYVARRSSSGWPTGSATPPQLGQTRLTGSPLILLPSFDFSRFVFGSIRAGTRYSPEEPSGPFHSVDLYLSENPFVAPVWLGKPTASNPIPKPGDDQSNELGKDFLVAGATPTLSTVYFAYSGTLIAQDASRAPNVGDGEGTISTAPWGFYEWSGGTLAAAGVLPDGTVSPFGAIPAAVAGDNHRFSWQAGDFNNEVSADGSRAFFVSPDPAASTSAPPELYVRETAPDGTKSTVLVSQSQLPGHVGEPAPGGPVGVDDATLPQHDSTYVYASPDGSQAFFASSDRLTEAAPEGTAVKEYDFDLRTGALTYLPGVAGPIVASSRDGSNFIFKNTATTPQELGLWSAGPNGGRVRSIAQLPQPANLGESNDEYLNGQLGVAARASADGSVFLFDTNAPVPGGFNNQGGFGQVYRYDMASDALTCVSCPPAGVTPSGSAVISYDNSGGFNDSPTSTVDTRAMSSDGSMVFFDTPDPLVSQDSNGKRDVYEWEDGAVHLISSGASPEGSFYLDSSESGNDVFFNTTDGLVAGDADGSFDAYDARVPHPGDTPPPAAVPCQGDVCQGPPSVPSLLGAPASATFSGAGNLTPPKAKPSAKKKTVKKKPKHKKKAKRKKGKRARKAARKNYERGK